MSATPTAQRLALAVIDLVEEQRLDPLTYLVQHLDGRYLVGFDPIHEPTGNWTENREQATEFDLCDIVALVTDRDIAIRLGPLVLRPLRLLRSGVH